MRRKLLDAFRNADIEGILDDLVKQAATMEGARGGDKREFVIRKYAEILDKRFKFGWFMELIDGGLFYVAAKILAPAVEFAYQKMVTEMGLDPLTEYRKLTEQRVTLENRIKELEAQLEAKKEEEKPEVRERIEISPRDIVRESRLDAPLIVEPGVMEGKEVKKSKRG